jgi:exonuclease VII small subunit
MRARVEAKAALEQAEMRWRREVRDVIAQLEDQRTRLEQVRKRARRQGGPEGERLVAQTETRLRDVKQRINDLRASLE